MSLGSRQYIKVIGLSLLVDKRRHELSRCLHLLRSREVGGGGREVLRV